MCFSDCKQCECAMHICALLFATLFIWFYLVAFACVSLLMMLQSSTSIECLCVYIAVPFSVFQLLCIRLCVTFPGATFQCECVCVCVHGCAHLFHLHLFDVISEHSLVCHNSLGHIPVRVLVCVCESLYPFLCTIIILMSFGCIRICVSFPGVTTQCWYWVLMCMYGCALLCAPLFIWFYLYAFACVSLVHSFCVFPFLGPHSSTSVCLHGSVLLFTK